MKEKLLTRKIEIECIIKENNEKIKLAFSNEDIDKLIEIEVEQLNLGRIHTILELKLIELELAQKV